MIVETSAAMALIFDEPDTDWIRVAMRMHRRKYISAANVVESAVVVDSRRDPALSRELDRFLSKFHIDVVSVTESQARLARQAYRDFGRGSGHKAQLNFGDCFAYALAQETGEPLLYKGEDFAATGIRSVLPNP